MNKPWYRCTACDKLKLKSKKTYTIVMTGTEYERIVYMCPPCGDEIDRLHREIVEPHDGKGPIDL